MTNQYKNFDWDSIGFNFGNWEEELVWALELPVQSIAVERLIWHLEIPYWENNEGERWTISPQDVIGQKPGTETEQNRVKNINTEYPIDLFEHDGKLFVLDGLHRLVHLYTAGIKQIRVRIVPEERFPEIASVHPFELPSQD